MPGKTFNLKSEGQELDCHLMPCRIEEKQSIQIKAKEYFYPTIRVLKDDDDDYKSGRPATIGGEKNNDQQPIVQASFRGRPLQGRKIDIPHQYVAHILKESKSANKFSKFTYWNWDELPNERDVVVKAFQWLDIANAIHGD